ncbi:SLC26A/SulP transporter family protein [Hydrogenophaga sp.]|uniref:SLC26A/SulP transporter family protein n=1 Tax=Hydrogenophaga sp. TaxID=1904254 RepID=UPI003F724BAA
MPLTPLLAAELAPRQLLGSFAAALILYLLVGIMTLSIAAMVYAGPLATLLPQALGGILVGVALLVAVISLFAAWGGTIGTTQDGSGVILALGAAAAAAAMPAAAPDVLAATVSTLLLLATLAFGGLCLLLGSFGLGTLVRYLPMPVIGGFLAGTGWLLVVGGIGVAAQASFGWSLLEPGAAFRWLPALVLGAVMLMAVQVGRHGALLVAISVLATLLFYAVMGFGFDRSASQLAEAGWLLGPFPEQLQWHMPLAPHTLATVDWGVLMAALPTTAPAILIGALALMLSTSALELVIQRDLPTDHELRVQGMANIACACAGGLIGYTAISVTSIGHALAPARRLPGLLPALMLLATALLGAAAIAAVPRFVVGGLLVCIGLALLQEWLLQARRGMARGDYAAMLAIFAVIVATNFLWGIAFGLLAATVLFVVNYSRINVVRHALDGRSAHSRVQRGERQRLLLQQQAHRLRVFKLQGFVFFGSASALVDRLGSQLTPRTRFVLLDFEHVSGLDSTALTCFTKLRRRAELLGAELVLAGLSPQLERPWKQATDGPPLPIFPDLDHAIEWCEERLLLEAEAGHTAPPDAAMASLREQLLAVLPDAVAVDALLLHTTPRALNAGETLLRQGDAPDALFIVEAGRLTACLTRGADQPPLRLESMCAGALIGEIGFVLDRQRSADVIADVDSRVRVLDRATWERLTADDPLLARTLGSLLLRLLAQRTLRLTDTVDALQR